MKRLFSPVAWAGLLFLCALTVSGCMPQKPMAEPPPPSALAKRLNKEIKQEYPVEFKAVHHALLTIAGRDYPLKGYLTVSRKDRNLSLVAQNDLGGTVFELFSQNSHHQITVKRGTIKKKWIEKSVLKDLTTLYFAEPFASPRLFTDKNGRAVLFETRKGITRKRIYRRTPEQKSGYRLTGIRETQEEQCRYAVDLSYDKEDHLHPDTVVIHNRTMHYRLKINVHYYF
ncbi:MAG: DUF3261 domain-containing protein [Desulfobacteraceae bacterium]